jgi:hypothetical protein
MEGLSYSKAFTLAVVLAVLSWVALACVLFFTNPGMYGGWAVAFWYAVFAVSVAATSLCVLLPVRRKFFPAQNSQLLSASFRQSCLLGVLAVAMFGLQAERLLFWWVAGSLILLIICIEAFFSI